MHPLLQLDSNTYYEWADGNGGDYDPWKKNLKTTGR